ncbi:hypothetical protein [Thiomicrorhabdus indica]|uniref:hypothetical protein n=1 Tax=Thiomicrorhabdus indica TaxID=2267253 RepID=UPI00102D857F|nr:hypothetical protein [Thiomicrorhabdus indica]
MKPKLIQAFIRLIGLGMVLIAGIVQANDIEKQLMSSNQPPTIEQLKALVGELISVNDFQGAQQLIHQLLMNETVSSDDKQLLQSWQKSLRDSQIKNQYLEGSAKQKPQSARHFWQLRQSVGYDDNFYQTSNQKSLELFWQESLISVPIDNQYLAQNYLFSDTQLQLHYQADERDLWSIKSHHKQAIESSASISQVSLSYQHLLTPFWKMQTEYNYTYSRLTGSGHYLQQNANYRSSQYEFGLQLGHSQFDQSVYNGSNVGLNWTLSGQQQYIVGLNVNLAQNPARPGGDQSTLYFGVSQPYDYNQHYWQLGAYLSYTEDENLYSPLILPLEPREQLKMQLFAAYEYRLMDDKKLFIEASALKQKSNIDLFDVEQNAIQAGMIWSW